MKGYSGPLLLFLLFVQSGICCLCGQRTANQESGSQSYNRIKFMEYGKNQRIAEYVVSLADSSDTVGAKPVPDG